MRALKQVAIWENVTAELFQKEIAPLAEPAILKGLVGSWPIIQAVNNDNSSENKELLAYLSDMYVGGDVRIAEIAKGQKAEFFYNKTLTGFNFERKVTSYTKFINQLTENATLIKTHSGLTNGAIAIQSAPIKDYFPPFTDKHPMHLFDVEACHSNKNITSEPRFWLGNKSTVIAHYDDAENIACVVAGKRKVTLFPPEQIANLYGGPLEFTPAGAPVSMVNLAEPDFEKFPKFKQALNYALVAELEPGDALYIPTLWWHHVEALSEINMLVNYWSGGSIMNNQTPVPMDAMLLAIMTIRELPEAQRKAWKSFFDYQVFDHKPQQNQHIPEQIKGVLASLTDEKRLAIKQWLLSQLH